MRLVYFTWSLINGPYHYTLCLKGAPTLASKCREELPSFPCPCTYGAYNHAKCDVLVSSIVIALEHKSLRK